MLIYVAYYVFNGLTKFLHGSYLTCACLSRDTRVAAWPLHWSSVDAPMRIRCGFTESSFKRGLNPVTNLCSVDRPLFGLK